MKELIVQHFQNRFLATSDEYDTGWGVVHAVKEWDDDRKRLSTMCRVPKLKGLHSYDQDKILSWLEEDTRYPDFRFCAGCHKALVDACDNESLNLLAGLRSFKLFELLEFDDSFPGKNKDGRLEVVQEVGIWKVKMWVKRDSITETEKTFHVQAENHFEAVAMAATQMSEEYGRHVKRGACFVGATLTPVADSVLKRKANRRKTA